MNIVQFIGQERVLGAPGNWDHDAVECQGLPIKTEIVGGYSAMISYWAPTLAELAALNSGACVRLVILSSEHPVVAVETESVQRMS
jgi:hypothetical protein